MTSIAKQTSTYKKLPKHTLLCHVGRRVMKAHGLPDHNCVAFMNIVPVKKNHIIPLKSLPKTIVKLWNKDCDPAMQSLLAHKILNFVKHKSENQPIYFEEECLEDEWAYGYWQLCGPARARCAYFLSVVHPQFKLHYIPSAWSTLYSPLYSGSTESTQSQSCKSQVHPRSPRAWLVPWPARGS